MSHPLRWLALVALEGAETPSFENIAAWHREQFPDAPKLTPAGATVKLMTLSIGEFTAAITLVPQPIPASQLEGPAATSWYWPDAEKALRGHQAHLLVTLIDEGGAAVKKAEALTRLVAAITAVSPSVGVFWGPGRLVHSPEAFIDQTVQMRADNLPLFLWIDFRIEQIEAGAFRLYTTGLEPLGHSELEVTRYEGSPQELLDLAYNIAHYMLDKRKVLTDGDTIGVTEQVQVVAHRGPSMLGGEMEVIRLDFETDPSDP
ncbi:MAG: DUF4261 domain-containing protein [Pirellulales bacterium]|nr:DUF4261 domain-containing protein [Pirellulales bacterium]